MQKNSILLETLTVEQLQQLMSTTFQNSILQLQKELNFQNNSEELMSRDETCKFLKIDSSTLWAWTNKGKVLAHGIGARRYYKRSELLQCLILIKK